jgi:hypothetical protein
LWRDQGRRQDAIVARLTGGMSLPPEVLEELVELRVPT